MAFDSKHILNTAIRYLADAAIQRNAGGWVPPKEQARQEKEQARAEEKQKREDEKSQKILSKQFPTHYMPNVGRQVMQDGGTPKSLSQIINRQQDIPPSTPDPTPEELADARADTRVGRDIVAKRLNVVVPESERVVGGKYRPGAPGGGRWSDLPTEVLNSPGRGFNVTDEELQDLWNQSLAESSQAARNAAKEHKVVPKFLANDWDKAMRLPLSDHLWYELSGEKMAENMPDLTHPEFLKLMDIIGATSARAKPGENLERSLAALSQHLRKRPIDVDLTIPETVRQALGRSHEGSSALPGNKTGYFSDTLALTGGVPTRMPISVNDVWVGKMFGVPDNVMSSNQSLHEPMAKYFNKIRDLYNERHGHEVPFPYQSWNFQAPAWVHLRGEEAGEESGDAYHQVWDNIIKKLKDNNVPGINGNQITREALMHPGFADALRRTTAPFRASPKATVEFGTKLTNTGETAHKHYQRAIQANDELSQNEYLGGLTKAMYASARGEGHPWERLKKAITGVLGQPSDITRIAHPTSENPLDIGGTFEGDVSPNIRVPLKDMTDDQIAYFNAVAGKHLKQKSMAASYVLDADDPRSEPRKDHIRGYSAFVPTTESMAPEDIRSFASELSKIGHDMSYVHYPNGYRFDVIPNYNGDIPKGIDHAELADAYDASLKNKYGDPAILAHDFKSVYTPDTEYDGLKSKLVKEIQSDFIKQAQEAGIPIGAARKILADSSLSGSLKGRSRKAWDTYSKRIDHLAAAEQGFKDLAQRVSDAHSNFITKVEKRQKKYPQGFADGGSVYEPHKRAEEQGYSIKGFHVTRGDRANQISSANRFDPYQSQLAGEEASFFWDDPEAANKWVHATTGIESFDPEKMSPRDIDKAERHASTIMPVRIHPGKHSTIDWVEATGRHDYDPSSMKQILGVARKMGFDTLRIKNMHEYKMGDQPHDQIAVLNPHVIRSEFAKFDPENKGRDDLGAARGGAIDHDELQKAERAGRNGDTMLAHINPQEAELLKQMGGSGTINPETGLPQFDNPSMGDYGGGGYGVGQSQGPAANSGGSGSWNSPSGGGGGGGNGGISASGGGGGGGGSGGGNSGMPGIGLGSVNAFGNPGAINTFGSTDPGKSADKQMSDILAGGISKSFVPGGNIGGEMLKQTMSGGNANMGSALSNFGLNGIAPQPGFGDKPSASMAGNAFGQNMTIGGSLGAAQATPEAQWASQNDPMGITHTVAVGQAMATPQTGIQDPSHSAYAEQMAKTAREAWLAANTEPQSPRLGDLTTPTPNRPFTTPNRAGSIGSMPIGTTPHMADMTPLSAQPARPVTPTPFSSFPQDVQRQMIPNLPDSAFGQTLIDPTGKYTQQALDKMKVAEDAVTMLNSPTLAGSLFRAFTPTPTPATPQQQAAIERMYKGAYSGSGTSSGSSIRSGFNQAFAEARARGDSTFSWTNPATGKTGTYTTQLARKDGGRIPTLDNPDDWSVQSAKNSDSKAKKKSTKISPDRDGGAIVSHALMLSSKKS